MTGTRTLGTAEPKHYVWWFPGSPVKVHLDLQTVQRLRQRLSDSENEAAEEGLLFGRTVGGATEILDFLPAADASVADMIAALPPEKERSLIGYYRTEEAGTFRLNAKDLSLAGTCLAKPYHVFLMIQSNGFGPPNATFFFHDGPRMTDFAFLEFPFDPVLLAMEEQNRIQRALEPGAENAVAVPAAGPVSTVPVRQRKRRGVLLKALVATCCVAVAFVAGVLFNNGSFRARSSRIWNGIFSAPATPSAAPSVAASPAHSMALHAVRQNGDVQLTWDRESPVIAAATSGVIFIQDGQSNRMVPLDARVLRGGSLLYSPASDQITIQLAVTTPAETVAESVIVIVPKVGDPLTYALPQPRTASIAVKPGPPPAESAPLPKAARPFLAPAPAKGTPAAAPPALQDAPAIQINPATSTAIPSVVPAAPVPPPPAPQVTSQQPPPAVAAYEPPVAVVKVSPAYPREFGETRQQIVVQVKIGIDENGKVVKAEAVPQENVSKFVLNSAASAARQWKFQPARSNHLPVPSEMFLQFTFKPR